MLEFIFHSQHLLLFHFLSQHLLFSNNYKSPLFIHLPPTSFAANNDINILSFEKEASSKKGKIKTKKRANFVTSDLFSSLSNENCISLIRITKDEFNIIIKKLKSTLRSNIKCMNIENQIYLCFLFIIQYYNLNTLSYMFNSSTFIVSSVLDTLLPKIASFFQDFVPNNPLHSLSSSISDKIKFIIDNTLHRTRKSNFEREGSTYYSYY